jgi:cytochrome P450
MKEFNFPAGYNFVQSIGRTYRQIKDPVGTMLESMERFRGTYSVHLGLTRFIVTEDPEFVEYVLKTNHKNYHKSPLQSKQLGRFLGKGLLTSNGEFWLKQRRLIQPGFHMDKIHGLYGIIKDTVHEFLKTVPTGKDVDVYPLMNTLAFQLVINTLFDIEVSELRRNLLNRFIYETQAFVIKDIRQPHKSWWFRLSGELKHNLDQARAARGIIGDLIRERQKSGEKRNDLLDMLLDARYEDTGKPMDEEQIIDEILVLIIAGHETTANALAWTLYLLANNPHEKEKLKATTRGLGLTETVVSDHLNNVLKESMRLYPPAWISDRISLNDDKFKSYSFPRNTIIVLFYYGMHRNPAYWQDPEKFDPSRFVKTNADKDKIKAYYPFGAGPRLCIGNNFAMAEMTIFLQAFLDHFEITPGSMTPRLNALVTLKPDKILLGLTRLK